MKENASNINFDESINIKKYIFKFLARWYLFVISTVITLTIAYLYNRYSEPLYRVSCTLLVRENSNLSDGFKSIINNFGASNKSFQYENKLETEIAILRSKNLIGQAVNALDFGIQYVGIGTIKNKELYKESVPFEVQIDSLHRQLLGHKIYLSILSDKKYLLEIEDGVNISREMTFSEKFITNDLGFRIILKDKQNFNPLNLNYGYEGFYFVIYNNRQITNEYIGKLSVQQPNKDAAILYLSSTGKVPEKEADFLNKLSDIYIRFGIEEKSQIATNAIRFIDNQLEGIVDSLNLAETRLQNFRLSNNAIIDISQEGQALFRRLETLQIEGSILDIEAKYYDYLSNYIKDRKSDFKDIMAPSAIGINDPLLTSLIAELSKLYSEKSVVEYSARENNPTLNVINVKIENAYNTLLENVRNIMKSKQLSIDDNRKRTTEVKKEIQRLPVTERKLINIQRKFDLNDEIYTYLLEKRAEAGIAKASIISDNKVLDFASANSAALVSPERTKNNIIALVSGIFIPILLIFLRDFFNVRIRDQEDIEKITSIPILGPVGHSKSASMLIDFSNYKSVMFECFRSLYTNIQYFLINKDEKVISVISTVSGEGKTFCAINLAIMCAVMKKRTLLLGLDLRRPKIHREFNLSNNTGLSMYLVGRQSYEELILPTFNDNLFVVCSGPSPPNPAELIKSERMNEFFERARQEFDFIIIDTPPIALVTDAIYVTKFSDANIFIVRHNYTNINVLKLVDDLYNEKKLENLNLVINDVSLKSHHGISKYVYGYGGYKYGYEYGYGYGFHDNYLYDISEEAKNREEKSE